VMSTSHPLFGHLSPIITPLNAVSRCAPRSLSAASRTYPLRVLLANGANLTCVFSTSVELNGELRGRGRGPWTVHVSLRVEEGGSRDGSEAAGVVACNSRYAEPEAEGTRPVCRKILRGSLAPRMRAGRAVSLGSVKRGALVPPAGGFMRRRSAIVVLFGVDRVPIDNRQCLTCRICNAVT